MGKISYIILVLGFVLSCTKSNLEELNDNNNILYLKWNKNTENDKFNDVETALRWTLSYIGGTQINKGILSNENEGNSLIIIDISKLGFSDKTKSLLTKLNSEIKQNEGYKINKSVDLGRYICLILGSSYHYYKFTQQPTHLNQLLQKYELRDEVGVINNSNISSQNRLIFTDVNSSARMLFLAVEIDSSTGDTIEFETFDIMKNGQLRFAVYNQEKELVTEANPMFSNAGKPGKCIWCHESHIQPIFSKQDETAGYISSELFKNEIDSFFEMQITAQKSNFSSVDFSKKQEHIQVEIAYISFMEPSVKRLSSEWNLSKDKTVELLKNLTPHIHHEFPFLGELYYRNEVKQFAPFQGIQVSSDIREKSYVEVNYLD